ncbi:MAG: hypothetical protein WCH44_02565 [Betaproteobacteria bacterium]
MEKNVRIGQTFQVNRIASNYIVGRQAHCVSFSERKITSLPSKLEASIFRGATFLPSDTNIDPNIAHPHQAQQQSDTDFSRHRAVQSSIEVRAAVGDGARGRLRVAVGAKRAGMPHDLTWSKRGEQVGAKLCSYVLTGRNGIHGLR